VVRGDTNHGVGDTNHSVGDTNHGVGDTNHGVGDTNHGVKHRTTSLGNEKTFYFLKDIGKEFSKIYTLSSWWFVETRTTALAILPFFQKTVIHLLMI